MVRTERVIRDVRRHPGTSLHVVLWAKVKSLDFKREGKLLEDFMHRNGMILRNLNDYLIRMIIEFWLLCDIQAEREEASIQ